MPSLPGPFLLSAVAFLALAAPAQAGWTVESGCDSTFGDLRSIEFDPLTDLPIQEHPEGGSIVIVPVEPEDAVTWTVVYNVVCEALDRITECLDQSVLAADGTPRSADVIQSQFATCILAEDLGICPDPDLAAIPCLHESPEDLADEVSTVVQPGIGGLAGAVSA
jgi:hypothetical protein